MSQVLQHVEAASLFVDPMRHMHLATVISSSPGTTLCVGPVLSQAFTVGFPCLAKLLATHSAAPLTAVLFTFL